MLLNLDAGPKPDLIATDEASYSDMVFRVFTILGYRFSPRIADIGDTRYWRAGWPGDPEADYGPLNAIARNKVNLGKITAAWADMLRVAGARPRKRAGALPVPMQDPGAGLRPLRDPHADAEEV